MPSKKEIELFELHARYAANCWVFGVDIDETNGLIFPTKNKNRLIAQYAFLAYMLVVVLFCAYRNYIMYETLTTDNLGWFILYAVPTIGHGTYFTLYAAFAILKMEMTNLWNQLLHFSRSAINSKQDGNIREKILWIGHYCVILVCEFGVSFILAVPEYIFAAKQDGWWFAIGLGFSLAVFSVIWIYQVMITILIIYSLMFFINVKDVLDRNTLDSQLIKGMLRNFKLLALLCKNFNGSYALIAIPAIKYIVSMVGMIFLFMALRITVPPGMEYCLLGTSVVCMIVTVLLVNALSVIWSTSKNFMVRCCMAVADIKDAGRKSYLRRELRSLPPIRISVAGLYYMEAEAKLTFMHFLVNGIANLLIASK